jgi:GTP cyclohydrolase I
MVRARVVEQSPAAPAAALERGNSEDDAVAKAVPREALERMHDAVRALLAGVGEDAAREGLADTPRRVARAWLDMAGGGARCCRAALGSALFHEPLVAVGADGGGVVLVRDVAVAALSARDLLPFHGRAHVAYAPGAGVVLGLSKLARAARALAARVQTQGELGRALLAAVAGEVAPRGAAVIVEAAHLGAAAPARRTTVAVTGCFADPASGLLDELLLMLGLPDAAAAAAAEAEAAEAAEDAEEPAGAPPAMAAAVAALLAGAGEDAAAPRLARAAARHAAWLLDATGGYALGSAAAGEPQRPGSPEAGASLDTSDASDAASDASAGSAGEAGAGACCVHPRELLGRAPAGGAPAAAPAEAAPAAAGRGDGVRVFAARFASQCEHHLLPFYGVAKVAYHPAPGGPPPAAAAAALRRAVEAFSRRLQVQERLTAQVADAAAAALRAEAVLVVVESSHMCMVARGVEEHASATVTSAARGAWAAAPAARRGALRALLDLRVD